MRTCRKWALPPQHTHTLKPEPQEVVLCSISSGQTNYSPFEKCTFFTPFLCTFPPPPPHPPCLLLAPFIVFLQSPPERHGQGDRKVPYLRYLKMSCIHNRNELPLWLHRPPNSGKYSPAVFPQDLWYSCPQYPHNAFAEFPKWMKSRIIWSLWKVKHWSSLSLHGCIILLWKVNCEKQRTGMKWTVSVLVSWKYSEQTIIPPSWW